MSDMFQITCGIRQSGVLSPVLFSVYVDEILLELSNYGCRVKDMCYSSLMYADDLILLAPSVAELQYMVNICCDELNKLNLELNNNTSFCLRFGKRHRLPSVNINTVKGPISWVKETRCKHNIRNKIQGPS